MVEIVKNVLLIIIITGFMELLLPEGGMRPFVRYAIGLFVIVAILNPVLSALFHQHHFEISWWDTPSVEANQDQIAREGQRINRQITAVNSGDLQQKMEGQVGAVVNLVPGVKEVEVHADIDDQGQIRELQLNVRPEAVNSDEEADRATLQVPDQKMQQQKAEVIKGKIKDLLKNLYALQEGKIDITIEGS